MNIRYAQQDDIHWLVSFDNTVNEDWIRRSVFNKEAIVAFDEGPIGFLRFSMFWGKIPYVDLIKVNPEKRNMGVGSAMMTFWENEMRSKGFDIFMTSAETTEKRSRDFHLKCGYLEIGEIDLNQSCGEVFYLKCFETS